MRILNSIRNMMLAKEILTPAQSSNIKGGAAKAPTVDDKRRPRPGYQANVKGKHTA